jgi:hypothetical protein
MRFASSNPIHFFLFAFLLNLFGQFLGLGLLRRFALFCHPDLFLIAQILDVP